MKKITENFKASLLAIVLLFFTANIFAMDIKPTVKVLNAKNKIFALVITEAKSTMVNFKIMDTDGATLLNEKVKLSNKVTKSYNLSNLPSGIYEIELEDDYSFRKQIIKITSDKLEILERKERKVFKPTILKKGTCILLNALSLEGEAVIVDIYDNNGTLLYSDKIKNTQTVHRQYDFSKVYSNGFSVRVIMNGKVFREEFTI